MLANELVELMRCGASLTCLGEYALETAYTVLKIPPRVVGAAVKSGKVEQICNNGSPILRYQLTAQEENE